MSKSPSYRSSYPSQIALTDARIRGRVNGAVVYTGTNLTQEQTFDGKFDVRSTTFTGTMNAPSTIEVWNDLSISWAVEYTTMLNTHPGGTSTNDFFFVLRDPPVNWKLLHTVLTLACIGGEGLDLSESDLVAEGIFDIFAELNVKRAEDQEELAYYGSWMTPWSDYLELVKERDANCFAWADLYVKCLLAAGLGDPNTDSAIYKVQFKYNRVGLGGPSAWMFMKDWTPAQSRTPDQYDNDFPDQGDAFPHLNIPVQTYPTAFYTNDQYNWHDDFADFTDQEGEPGQNEPDPQSLFTDHVVVRYGDVLFDPSYGKRYGIPQGATGNDILAPIDAAIDGYGLGYLNNQLLWLNEAELNVDLGPPAGIQDMYVQAKCFIIMENPAGNQLAVHSTTPQSR